MPSKGRTCKNCAGTCCTIGIAYSFGDRKPKWFHGSHNIRHSTLLSLGAKEFLLKDVKDYTGEIICASFKENKCSCYDTRPALCKSYYCHGKYWKPKNG